MARTWGLMRPVSRLSTVAVTPLISTRPSEEYPSIMPG